MSLPSASKLQLALLCPGSAALPQARSVGGSAAEIGTWKHRYLQALVATGDAPDGRERALAAVPAEHRTACESLPEELPGQLAGMGTELALAYNVASDTVRSLGRDIGREYGALGPDELPMSLDFDGHKDGRALIVELKTGRGFVPPPEENWQLRVQALALARYFAEERVRASIITAVEGASQWDTVEWDAFDLVRFAYELREGARRIMAARAAVAASTQPELAQGEHCRYCPARHACPARVELARALGGDSPQLGIPTELSPATAAAAWHRLKAIRALCGDMEDAVYALAARAPLDLGAGRWLGQVESRREELDANAVYRLLAAQHGADAALGALKISATKAGLQRALSAVMPRGQGAAALRAAMAALRATDAVHVRVTLSVQECAAADLAAPPALAESVAEEN